ncbi:MAG: glycosyltransferase family 39 protein [Leptospirales bacterium]|nr:glycosyltransferase family 39 protein [Leptospirales bacterium]
MTFRDFLPPGILSLVFLVLQAFAAGLVGYGIFADELYYLACARHLAAGYVDHPPLSIWILWALPVTGKSLLALRLAPALAGACTVFLTGLMARRLGGSPGAAFLAAACAAAMPVLQVVTGFYSMNAFELLIFVTLLLVLLEIQLSDRVQLWPWVGLLVGLGVMNKHTMGLLSLVFVLPIVLNKWRMTLKSGYFYLAGLVVAIVIAPNVYWIIEHDFISFEFYRNATIEKNIATSPVKGLIDQILATNPATLPVWAVGLYASFRRNELRPFGLAFIGILAVFLVSESSRPDRIMSIYPIMFAVGAVSLSDLIRRILSVVVPLAGLFFAPISMPLLSPEPLGKFVRMLGVVPQIEKGKQTMLPQWFADRFGWEDVAKIVDGVIETLPPGERETAVVIAPWYGPAGAIELYSKTAPTVVSGHNSYYLWGLPLREMKTFIVIGYPIEALRPRFKSVEPAGFYTRPYSTEENVPVVICRDPVAPLREQWRELRRFN